MTTNFLVPASIRPAASLVLQPPAGPPAAHTTAVTYAGRVVRQYVRTPQLLVVNALTSVMFLLIFRYVFGGAISVGGSYVNFLIPGLLGAAGLFTGGIIGVAADAESGFLDRLRSLPVSKGAVIVGRSLADTALIMWSNAVTLAVGFAVGFRPTSFGAVVAVVALSAVFAFAFSWLHIVLGLIAGSAQAAQGLQFAVFPLIFVSSTYVPVDSMPGWLAWIARNQPVTAMVDALRAITVGGDTHALFGSSTATLVGRALVWSAVIAVVFAALCVRRFGRNDR